MAAKSKPESQKQECVFADNHNGDAIKLTNEHFGLPTITPSKQNSQSKSLHAGFTTKTSLALLITHDDLQRTVQQLVDDINAKRKRDADSLAEVRKALEIQLNNSGNILEETLVGIYEENSKLIQDKLQEIFSTLDRISNLERELSEFKQALELLYQDLRDPSIINTQC